MSLPFSIFLRASLSALLLFVTLPVRAQEAADSDVIEGTNLAIELRNVRPPQSFTNSGILRVRDAGGKRSGIPVTIRTLVAADSGSWQVIYEAKVGATNETLVITHESGRVPGYEVSRAVVGQPAGAPHPLGPEAVATPFAGSDFWAGDLGFDFLHWPGQKIIRRAKPEMRMGRPCRILESSRPAGAGYVRVRSWIDVEYGRPLIAEAYDAQDHLLKEFSVGSAKKVNGVWQLKDMEITNERDGTVTKLEFDLNLPQ
ncbi:MAG TPA: outer membrane lipoprotein-sorting protein [Candidatus Limnocylindria bacterium]|jgi:hypothetical protein|nr:outer membrane lipoprotein-sorting protein [Candidatus Limnocylindria bacterium]